LSRFRIVTHCKIKLEFLFNNEQLQRQVQENNTANYKVKTIVQKECEGKLQLLFPKGSQSNVMAMGTTCITHSAVGSLYLQHGKKVPAVLNKKANSATKLTNEDNVFKCYRDGTKPGG
jgi:molybdopterin-binding protein